MGEFNVFWHFNSNYKDKIKISGYKGTNQYFTVGDPLCVISVDLIHGITVEKVPQTQSTVEWPDQIYITDREIFHFSFKPDIKHQNYNKNAIIIFPTSNIDSFKIGFSMQGIGDPTTSVTIGDAPPGGHQKNNKK